MTKAFVTGANGFIGSHLVRELLKRGYEVNCLVRRTSDLSPLHGLPVSIFVGDILEPETLVAPMKAVECVYHLAAELMATEREVFEQTIVIGTTNMLHAAEQHAAKTLKRFLFVSSQAAGGPGKDQTPIDETAEPQPMSWYGGAKKRAEEAAHSFGSRIPVTIVRPSSVYGEREKDISQTYGIAQLGLQPKLGIKTKYLVMVYVGDLVRGIIGAAESGNTLNQVYFLNHPQVLTSRDTIKAVAQAMDKPRGLLFPVPLFLLRLAAPFAEMIHQFTRQRPKITRDKAKEISQRFWVASPAKAKRDFGWKAEHDLLSGMKITIHKFLEEEATIRKMPLEKNPMLWLKYVLCSVFIGALLEFIAACGRFYTYHPRWIVVITVVLWFGLILGTLAQLWRRRSGMFQLVSGTVLAAIVELQNALRINPSMGWKFAPGWPFGITNIWVRSLVVGLAGGIFVVIVNYLMRLLYKKRLRLG